MKTVSDHFAAPFCSAGRASDGGFDSTLLGRIGDDLRHHFDDSLDSELPRSLRELAETIDARRMGETSDE